LASIAFFIYNSCRIEDPRMGSSRGDPCARTGIQDDEQTFGGSCERIEMPTRAELDASTIVVG
jgi:hypothetical protein